MANEIARGIRNNNPGNIIKNPANKWQGLADAQTDDKFVQFKSMAYGVRALANTLITYQDKYNLRTIKAVINKYAPEKENATANYVACVCGISGFSENEILDFHKYENLEPVVRGIIFFENHPDHLLVKQEDIDLGLSWQGVHPEKPKPLIKDPQVQGVVIASASGLAALAQNISDAATTLTPALGFFDRIGNWTPWLGSALIIVGFAYFLYTKIKERNRGR